MSRINFSRKNVIFLAIFLVLSILLVGIVFSNFKIEHEQPPQKPHSAGVTKPAVDSPTSTASPAAEKKKEPAVLPEGTDIKITLNKKDTRELVITKQLSSIKIKNVPIQIPAGWEFANGSRLKQGEVVGKGRLSFVFEGEQRSVGVSVVNDKNVGAHKAHWLFHFGDPNNPLVSLDAFLDGSRQRGHTLIIERKFAYDVSLPVKLDLTIYANALP